MRFFSFYLFCFLGFLGQSAAQASLRPSAAQLKEWYQRYTYIKFPSERRIRQISNYDPAKELLLVRNYQLRYGFINLQGEEVIPCEYDDANEFRYGNDWVYAKKDGIAYSVNREGKTKYYRRPELDLGDENLRYFYKTEKNKDKKKGVKKYSEVVIPAVYNQIEFIKRDSLFLVRKGKYYDYGELHFFRINSKEENQGYNTNETETTETATYYGLFDRNGKTIFPCVYDYLRVAEDYPYIIASKKGKFGLYTKQGVCLIKPQYRQLSGFKTIDNTLLFAAQQTEEPYLWGIVNASNKVLQPFIYSEVDNYAGIVIHSDLHAATDNLINKKGKKVLKDEYFSLTFMGNCYEAKKFNGEVDFYKKNGKILVNSTYLTNLYEHSRYEYEQEYYDDETEESIYTKTFTIPFFIVRYKDRVGVLNNDSTWFIPPQYENITKITEGYIVSCADSNSLRYGLLDLKGKTILPTVYKKIAIEETKQGGTKIILEADTLTPYPYSNYSEIYAGAFYGSSYQWLVYSTADGGTVFLNPKKLLHQPPIYDKVEINSYYDEDNYFIVKQGNFYALTDTKGKVAFSIEQRQYTNLESMGNGLFRFEQKVKVNKIWEQKLWGIINRQGKVLCKAFYDKIFENYNSDDVFIVKKGEKYGFIDCFGVQIVPCVLDQADNFRLGLGRGKRGKQVYYINRKGQYMQLPPPSPREGRESWQYEHWTTKDE